MKTSGCASLLFETTGWLANILTILEHLGIRTIEVGGTSTIVLNIPWPQHEVIAGLIILYGLTAAAALLWNVIYHRIISLTEALVGFFILHGIITSVLAIPYLLDLDFEKYVIPLKIWNCHFLLELIIWVGYIAVSGIAGWFVCRIWTAPKV